MKARLIPSSFILAAMCVTFIGGCSTDSGPKPRPEQPNVVIIFTDDQGYGDLGTYGATDFDTPYLDKLASEGTRFTSFYVQPVCGPSRSALLTGRYPVRSHGWSMPGSEITIAELMKEAGYVTGCVGKWDVSNRAYIEGRVPNDQGFDYYWGPLGANDATKVDLYDNRTFLGDETNMAGLTRRYTDKAIEFMTGNKDKPFFLYLAHTMMHSVIDASPEFKGKSNGGLYGDTMEELDFHCGRLLDKIDDLGLRDNTLVIFTSDNGPWNNHQENLGKKHGGQIAWGSSGPLREGKGSTWEGGVRVPCIVRWPGQVPEGRINDAIFTSVDFLPTFANLTGFTTPDDRVIDGVDQTALLLGETEKSADDLHHYLCKNQLHGVRKGDWKLLTPNRTTYYGYVDDVGTKEVLLYNLKNDIGETTNVAAENQQKVMELLTLVVGFNMPKDAADYKIDIRLPKK
jgi:arylsulfatase A-like enzyme